MATIEKDVSIDLDMHIEKIEALGHLIIQSTLSEDSCFDRKDIRGLGTLIIDCSKSLKIMYYEMYPPES